MTSSSGLNNWKKEEIDINRDWENYGGGTSLERNNCVLGKLIQILVQFSSCEMHLN